MGGISTLEYEKKWENVTPDGRSWTKEEAEGRANWLSFLRDKDAGTYSLSVRDNNPQKGDHVKHYSMQMHGGNGFIINKQSVFPMLLWRVRHYQRMVKEGPIEAAIENTIQLCPLKKEEELKETEDIAAKNAALGEQNTSLPPASNTKEPAFTCITKLAGIEPKYMWMLRLILFVLLISGANGIKVEEGKYRKVIIATNEIQIATDPIEGPNDGSIFVVVTEGGNDPRESFKADSDFVIENQSCYIEVGNKNQSECEGLEIIWNGTHNYLAVDGSMLTHDRTAFYIYQQVPSHYSLYFLDVYKNQAPDRTNTRNRNLVNFLFVVAAVLAILFVTFATLYCLQRRSKGKSTKQVRKNDIKMKRLPSHDNSEMSNGSPA